MQTTANKTSNYPNEKNRVLDKNFHTSQNFYQSDKILQNYLKHNLSGDGLSHIKDKLEYIGKEAAGKMNEISMLADKSGPELIKRDAYGETINEIRFHPAYWDLMQVAVKSEMVRVKWEPTSKKNSIKKYSSLVLRWGISMP